VCPKCYKICSFATELVSFLAILKFLLGNINVLFLKYFSFLKIFHAFSTHGISSDSFLSMKEFSSNDEVFQCSTCKRNLKSPMSYALHFDMHHLVKSKSRQFQQINLFCHHITYYSDISSIDIKQQKVRAKKILTKRPVSILTFSSEKKICLLLQEKEINCKTCSKKYPSPADFHAKDVCSVDSPKSSKNLNHNFQNKL
jgi:hypothetical protein